MELDSVKKIVRNIFILDLIHFECSAYTGDNVDEIFTSLTKHIINKIENGIIEPSSVVSSYTNKVKNVVMTNGVENKKNEEDSKCYSNC